MVQKALVGFSGVVGRAESGLVHPADNPVHSV
jgi:hypothetical protein